jgi:hypothetical protein
MELILEGRLYRDKPDEVRFFVTELAIMLWYT